MRHPRAIDEPLVDAYLARRALDYLVGFTLSPVLWRKLPGARSAGRVQSVALRLVCDREAEIERFRPQEYWSIIGAPPHARERGLHGAAGRHRRPQARPARRSATRGDADAAKRRLESSTFTVASVESKPQRRNPQPPFTTSTLQQEAQRKLGFDASRTMQIAQRLYEGVDIGGEPVGLITYMRTDGVDIAPEALSATRRVIERRIRRALPARTARAATTPRRRTRRRRTRRSARPTCRGLPARRRALSRSRPGAALRADLEAHGGEPDGVGRAGAHDHRHRCAEARKARRRSAPPARSSASTASSPSTRRAATTRTTRKAAGCPPMTARASALEREKIEANQHFTEPPPRYTEASLIKKMEELGIGRPSTYAQTMAVLRERGYVAPRQEAARAARTRAARHRLPGGLLPAATWNTTSRPTWRRSSTASPPASSPGRTCCAISGATSPANVETDAARSRAPR